MQNSLYPNYDNPQLRISFKIATILNEKTNFVSDDFKLLEVGRYCSNSVQLAHKINEYHVSLLRDYLFGIDLLKDKEEVKQLLSVEFNKTEGMPEKDIYSISFLGFNFDNPDLCNVNKLLEFINHYILSIDQGGFRGHVTFSVTLPQEAIDEFKTHSLNKYLGAFAFPDIGKKIIKRGEKGYFLNIGQMRQDDKNTKYSLGLYEQAETIIVRYNEFIVYLANYLPDYLIINVAEQS